MPLRLVVNASDPQAPQAPQIPCDSSVPSHSRAETLKKKADKALKPSKSHTQTRSQQKSPKAKKIKISGKLSTDYLNCFNEIMMVIELAADMPEMLDELRSWQPISYVQHFEKSGLRHSEVSIAGYHQLSPLRKQEFDILTEALNRLATLTIVAMADAQEPMLRQTIAQIAIKAFGYHITRAADFINANGTHALEINVADLQAAADDIMACG
jgi:hypothetical protein